MRVLVACEFSGVVRDAFLSRGHDAWSCDLLPSERPAAGHHYLGDVMLLRRGVWDLVIAHPPCTLLARAGARWWSGREADQDEAVQFARQFHNWAPRVCVENPPGKLGTAWRKADQYIQPWQFGHGETKMTGLWLKGLPLLQPTNIVSGREPRVHMMPPSADRWKERSRTYEGIAEAMADQWGTL